jgi:delta 1-pyrroline-5-carboxylate dehydrogenase
MNQVRSAQVLLVDSVAVTKPARHHHRPRQIDGALSTNTTAAGGNASLVAMN